MTRKRWVSVGLAASLVGVLLAMSVPASAQTPTPFPPRPNPGLPEAPYDFLWALSVVTPGSVPTAGPRDFTLEVEDTLDGLSHLLVCYTGREAPAQERVGRRLGNDTEALQWYINRYCPGTPDPITFESEQFWNPDEYRSGSIVKRGFEYTHRTATISLTDVIVPDDGITFLAFAGHNYSVGASASLYPSDAPAPASRDAYVDLSLHYAPPSYVPAADRGLVPSGQGLYYVESAGSHTFAAEVGGITLDPIITVDPVYAVVCATAQVAVPTSFADLESFITGQGDYASGMDDATNCEPVSFSQSFRTRDGRVLGAAAHSTGVVRDADIGIAVDVTAEIPDDGMTLIAFNENSREWAYAKVLVRDPLPDAPAPTQAQVPQWPPPGDDPPPTASPAPTQPPLSFPPPSGSGGTGSTAPTQAPDPTPDPTQEPDPDPSEVPVERVEVDRRDQLIADQETLLNTYRCLYGVDTELVPGGCIGTTPAEGPTQPMDFSGDPTQGAVDMRDELIVRQEALLNAYRCLYNVDIELVPGGCPV